MKIDMVCTWDKLNTLLIETCSEPESKSCKDLADYFRSSGNVVIESLIKTERQNKLHDDDAWGIRLILDTLSNPELNVSADLSNAVRKEILSSELSSCVWPEKLVYDTQPSDCFYAACLVVHIAHRSLFSESLPVDRVLPRGHFNFPESALSSGFDVLQNDTEAYEMPTHIVKRLNDLAVDALLEHGAEQGHFETHAWSFIADSGFAYNAYSNEALLTIQSLDLLPAERLFELHDQALDNLFYGLGSGRLTLPDSLSHLSNEVMRAVSFCAPSVMKYDDKGLLQELTDLLPAVTMNSRQVEPESGPAAQLTSMAGYSRNR